MERLFGEYLIKCKVLEKPAAEPVEEAKGDAADPDMPEGVKAEAANEEVEEFYPYEKVSVDDAMVRTHTAHVVVLFTAEYAPPCQSFV